MYRHMMQYTVMIMMAYDVIYLSYDSLPILIQVVRIPSPDSGNPRKFTIMVHTWYIPYI